MPKTKLVLLPGLDGTGTLFKPLLEVLGDKPCSVVVPLNDLPSEGAQDQASEIAKRLTGESYVLFAESYSGRIAYELCRLGSLSIKHIIFAASFLSRPTLLAQLGSSLPIGFLRMPPAPAGLLAKVFSGDASRTDLVQSAQRALDEVSDSTLRKRLSIVAAMKLPNARLDVPCTYIRPSSDMLVSRHAVQSLASVCPQLDVQTVKGGHFIAQSSPTACNAIISRVFAL